MAFKEYLDLFSNQGNLQVRVKFKNHPGTIADQTMSPIELGKLLCPDSNSIIQKMTFDEHPFEIIKYEINPKKSLMTIHAQPLVEV